MKRLFTSALTSLALLASPLSALTLDGEGILVFEQGEDEGRMYMQNAGTGYGVIHNLVNRCEGFDKSFLIGDSLVSFDYPIDAVGSLFLYANSTASGQGIDPNNHAQYIFTESMLKGHDLAKEFSCSESSLQLTLQEVRNVMLKSRAWVLENLNTRDKEN